MIQLHERQWRIISSIVWRDDRLMQLVKARDRMWVVGEPKIERRARLACVYLDVTCWSVEVVTSDEVGYRPVSITPQPPFPQRL